MNKSRVTLILSLGLVNLLVELVEKKN
jgi:hypothetical protein